MKKLFLYFLLDEEEVTVVSRNNTDNYYWCKSQELFNILGNGKNTNKDINKIEIPGLKRPLRNVFFILNT